MHTDLNARRIGSACTGLLFLALLACTGVCPAPLRALQESAADITDESRGPTGLVGDAVCALKNAVAWVGERVDASRVVPKVLSAQAWLTRHGFRPRLSGQGRQSGTGPWLDAGWIETAERPFALHLWAGITHLQYWVVGARAVTRVNLARHPIEVEISGQTARRPRDEFFGLGSASQEADRSDYKLVSRSIRMTLARKVGAELAVHLLFDWSRRETGVGTNQDLPDLVDVFTQEAAPGFGLVARAVAVGGGVAWRHGIPFSQQRRGAWIEADYRHIFGQSVWMRDFGRARLAVGAEWPVDEELGSLTLAGEYRGVRGGGSSVPFYDLPALGGAAFPALQWDRLRAREIFLSRFEARSRLWRQSADAVWVDGILFTALGLVGDDLFGDLSFSAVHNIFGLAFGVVTADASIGRVGVSYGSEGVRAVLAFGSTF